MVFSKVMRIGFNIISNFFELPKNRKMLSMSSSVPDARHLVAMDMTTIVYNSELITQLSVLIKQTHFCKFRQILKHTSYCCNLTFSLRNLNQIKSNQYSFNWQNTTTNTHTKIVKFS